MSRLLLSISAAALLQGGCGSKEKPATEGTEAPGAGASEAAETGVGPTPTVAVEDAAAPTEPEAAVEPKIVAAKTLPAEVKGAAESGLSGCVGFTEDGEKALVYVISKRSVANVTRSTVWLSATPTDGDGRTYVYEASCGGEDEAACVDGLPTRSVEENTALANALKDESLVACESKDSDPTTGEAVVRPLGRAVTVAVDDKVLTFAIDGGASGRLMAFDQVDEVTGRSLTAYASAATAHVFVALKTEIEPGLHVVMTPAIRGSELGIEPCTKPAGKANVGEVAALGPVADQASDVGCFAMTGDGQAALMAVQSFDSLAAMNGEADEGGDSDDAAALSLVWAGADHGEIPSCLLDSKSCTGEGATKRAAFIDKHGLTACPPKAEEVKTAGGSFALGIKADRLWLERAPLGPLWLASFKVDAHDGGDHESFDAAWQHPKGGPLFVLYRNEDTGLTQWLTKTIPTSAFGFCGEAP